MRIKSYCWRVAAISAAMAMSGIAKGQNSEPACSIGVSNFIGYGGLGRSNVAYTATAKTSFEQHLPDGNYIRGYVRTHQARDAAGRTMSEMAQGCRRDENGVPQAQFSVSVFDPVTKTGLNWQVGTYTDKIAHVWRQPDTPNKLLTPEELAARRKASQIEQPPRSEFKTDDLGTRTIAGVEVHGSRTTRTIPAGEEGNELPLVTLTETWGSKELGLVIMGIQDDPRRGRTTFEIDELSRTEPDPSVFAPPAGYKIEDRTSLIDEKSKP